MPEPGSRPIRRNDAETLLIGGQQQIADGGRDPDHDKGDQPAQIDISTGWIPVEGEERADAANGKRCNHAERQGEANGDDPKAIVDGLHRERVDVAASPIGDFPEQPFGAKAKRQQDCKSDERSGLPTFTVDSGEAGRGLRELVRHIRDGAHEHDDLSVNRAGIGI